MIRTLGPVAALLLSVALLLMGNGLQSTLTPIRASLEAFSPTALGLLGGGYYLGFGIGCFLGPHVLRRAGHIRAFAAMVAIASGASLVHPLVIDEWIWIGVRAVTGFCFACLFMVIESWLNEKATNETRGAIFSVYLVINLSVVTLGQLMLVLDDPKSFALFSLASILVSLAAVPLTMTRSAQPAPPQATRLRLLRLFRLSPVGVVGAFAVGMTNGAFWTMGPVFAQAKDGDAAAAAVFMSIGAISGALGQWPLGRASDKMDRRRVILAACLMAGIAGALMFLLGDRSTEWRLALIAGFGMFAIPMYALSAAHMNDVVEADGFVEAAGGLLLTFAIGAILGPVIASLAMSELGPSGIFAFTAATHFVLGGFIAFRMTRRAAVTEEDRGVFSEAAVQAQTVATMEDFELGQAEEEEPGVDKAGEDRQI